VSENSYLSLLNALKSSKEDISGPTRPLRTSKDYALLREKLDEHLASELSGMTDKEAFRFVDRAAIGDKNPELRKILTKALYDTGFSYPGWKITLPRNSLQDQARYVESVLHGGKPSDVYKGITEGAASHLKRTGDYPVGPSEMSDPMFMMPEQALFGQSETFNSFLRDPMGLESGVFRKLGEKYPTLVSPEINRYYDELDQFIPQIDNRLRETYRLPRELVTYRSAPKGVYPGDEKGYLITSMSKNVADRFPVDPMTRHYAVGDMETYKVMLPEGTPVLPSAAYGTPYRYMELLSPRGGRLEEVGERELVYQLPEGFAKGGLAACSIK
jgi:hypothetical protein